MVEKVKKNSRAWGTNPRATGTNPRALGTNPRAARRRPDLNDPAGRADLSSPPIDWSQMESVAAEELRESREHVEATARGTPSAPVSQYRRKGRRRRGRAS